MIINLTQHPSTPEQTAAGVVDVVDLAYLAQLLTFDSLPSREDVEVRADMIANFACEAELVDGSEEVQSAMIGGAPYLMAPLEAALLDRGITPLYAFSVRESIEETQPDGSVKKINVFRHEGFVGMPE